MLLKDSPRIFGLISILFHWITALLVIALFFVGQVMKDLPRGPEKGELMNLHQSLGMILLALVFLRLFWRISQGFPEPVSALTTLMNKIARIWHWSLMLVVVAVPVFGYLASESGFRGVPFFDFFIFPDVLESNFELRQQFGDIHAGLVKVLVPLVIIHILAAFKHHFWNKDITLKRMLFLSREKDS